MEDVCRFHRPEQGMPERQLPAASDGSPSRFNLGTRTPGLHGCLLRIQPDTHERGITGENILHHQSGFVLLQDGVVRLEECRSHI
jgi:hypothetical protein